MAQMVGDGANRGKSAPPPRPLPKPKKGGASERLAREFSARIAERNRDDAPMRKRTPEKWSTPFWGPLVNSVRDTVQAGVDANADPHGRYRPPAVAPRSQRAVQLYNQAEIDADTRGVQREGVADMYNNMAARQQMAERRAAREERDRTENAKAFTEAEWNALSPLQQAAAQANADLMQAVAQDFKTQGKHTANAWQNKGGTERVQGYVKKVDELFGEDANVGYKGMEFAPNTLAFLESRGITEEELAGKTLDDFVSGDALIDSETFAALDESVTSETPRGRNIAFAQRLAQGQLNYQEKLAAQLKRGDALMSGLTGRGTNAQAGTSYGANALPASTQLTKVRPELVTQIDKYMEALARPNIPFDEALSTISADLAELGASKEETAQIWENMIERTRAATTGERPWFDDVDFTMRKPLEVAKALGAPTLKRLGAK